MCEGWSHARKKNGRVLQENKYSKQLAWAGSAVRTQQPQMTNMGGKMHPLETLEALCWSHLAATPLEEAELHQRMLSKPLTILGAQS